MDIFNKLENEDKILIEDYIRRFAGDENVTVSRKPASLNWLLRFWDENKDQYLYKMMDNSFILEKNVKYEKSISDIIDEMRNNFTISNFRTKFCRHFNWTGDILTLVDYDILAKNSYDYGRFCFSYLEEKPLMINTGCKPVRMIGKVCEMCGIEGFEEFRLEHSRILNQKMLKGTLCLSIHPLDYITMSDNDYDWSSCMNWVNHGEFRMGTVEMMNSKCVVVAYLKGDKPFRFYNHYWNNKKWRNLFIVTPEIITGIKGYPYQSATFDKIVINWIKELAEKNLNWTYGDNIIAYSPEEEYVTIQDDNYNKFCFTTGIMYNDFGNSNNTHCVVNSNLGLGESFDIHYSGPTECMYCGEELSDNEDSGELEDTGCVICSSCATYHYCDCCGDRIDSYDSMYELDGELYCESCYYDHRCEDPITGEEHYDGNCYEVYLTAEKPVTIDHPMIRVYDTNELVPEYFKKIRTTYIDTGYWFSSKHCYYVRIDEGTEEGIGLFDVDDATLEEMKEDAFVEYSQAEKTDSCIF